MARTTVRKVNLPSRDPAADDATPARSHDHGHPSAAVPTEVANGPEGNGAEADAGVLEVERRVVRWWHPILLLIALALLYWFADTIEDVVGLRAGLRMMRDRIENLGTEGPLLFILAYVVLTLLWVPGSWLTLAAGALFGSVLGVAVVMAASTISASLAFIIARHGLRQRVEQWAGRNKRFRQLNRLTDRHGPAVVLTVRLVNLFPFALINYGFGLTHIRFRTYLLWSFLGKIPGTILIVVGVDAIIDALVERQVPWGLVVIVVATAALLGVALRLLHQRLRSDDDDDADE